jgi:hypothetical protein
MLAFSKMCFVAGRNFYRQHCSWFNFRYFFSDDKISFSSEVPNSLMKCLEGPYKGYKWILCSNSTAGKNKYFLHISEISTIFQWRQILSRYFGYFTAIIGLFTRYKEKFRRYAKNKYIFRRSNLSKETFYKLYMTPGHNLLVNLEPLEK